MSEFSASSIAEILAQRHPPDRWIFVTELSTTTGIVQAGDRFDPLGAKRKIDAFAMALWPSLGYERVAYEIKVSRQDWLRELNSPIKKTQAYLLSDHFYFVLAEGIFRKEDWIKTRNIMLCGIYEVQPDGRLKTIRAGGQLRAEPAWPMPEAFVASLLRRVRQMAEDRCD